MATYKVDVIAKFGKFHTALWQATAAKPDLAQTPVLDSIDDVVAAVAKALDAGGLDEDNDLVQFRGHAYDNFSALKHKIKLGTY